MSIELQARGVRCNLRCDYCYQNNERDAGNVGGEYDREAMWTAALAEGVGQSDGRGGKTGVTIFGGEALMQLSLQDLEWVCEKARGVGAPVGLQTNGSLITRHHVELFKKYNVGVGFSIDGPDELNDLRRVPNDPEATRRTTERSCDNLATLLQAGLSVSLIVTLTRTNASAERLPRLVTWVEGLHGLGLRWLNLHNLEVDDDAVRAQGLTLEEHVAALRAFESLEAQGLHVDPLRTFRLLLLGKDKPEDHVNCVWHACDPWTTPAVRGIDGEGNRKNCGRTNKDGVAWRKADTVGHERQLALYLTPQEHGGCAGCRFFFACKGECPGTGLDKDWRNRTEHCPTLMAMFTAAETKLVAEGQSPLSLSLRRPYLEGRLLEAWAQGQTPSIHWAMTTQVSPGNRPHGDEPHKDHTDVAAQRKIIEECGKTRHHDGPCARCGYGDKRYA